MTKVQEQCTTMVYSAAFWAAVRERMKMTGFRTEGWLRHRRRSAAPDPHRSQTWSGRTKIRAPSAPYSSTTNTASTGASYGNHLFNS
jgi:hypothetical protein